jgi:trehalose-6-phosphate synthase
MEETNVMVVFAQHILAITTKSLRRFYNGCCNATFWPLFHSMPDRTVFDIQTWQVKNMKTNI